MKTTVQYTNAVLTMSQLVHNRVLDAFVASTVLAVLFDMEKEDTLDSLMLLLDSNKKENNK